MLTLDRLGEPQDSWFRPLAKPLNRRGALLTVTAALAVAACGGSKKVQTTALGEASPLPAPPAPDLQAVDNQTDTLLGPTIEPGPLWNGVTGSGFGPKHPADPERRTAKPACRLLVPPNQYFTDMLMVGVFAAANNRGSLGDDLGIEKVIVHFEGNDYSIDTPTFYTFNDASQNTSSYFGWWIKLKRPENVVGHAHIYFEAVPKDRSMQNRVIGPFQFSPMDRLHDHVIEVNSTTSETPGKSYHSLTRAFEYLRANGADNPKIIITGGGPYNMPRPDFTYDIPDGWVTVIADSPIIFKNDQNYIVGNPINVFRPRVSGLCFRGRNITFDFINSVGFYTEIGGRLWLDGVNITNSHHDGAYRLYEGRVPQISRLWRENPWLTECTVSNVLRSGVGANLVRGGTFTNCADDLFTDARCVLGTVTSGLSSKRFREEIAAISLQYTGTASSATIAISGNVTSARTVTLKENGNVVAALTIPPPSTALPMMDVVEWIDRQTGWRANLLDGSRAGNYIGMPGNVETGFADTDSKSAALTLVSSIPLHTDWYQLSFGSDDDENVVLAFNKVHNSSAQNIFISGDATHPRDFIIINNAFDNHSSDGLLSQWGRAPFSHVVMAHNTWSTQGVILRADQGFSADGFCLIANNVMPTLTWAGTPDVEVVIADNHLMAGAKNPSGAARTTIGGSHNTLFVNTSEGDFTPAGELLSNLKLPVVAMDASGGTRIPPSPAGAFFS